MRAFYAEPLPSTGRKAQYPLRCQVASGVAPARLRLSEKIAPPVRLQTPELLNVDNPVSQGERNQACIGARYDGRIRG
jgi:hypothetical protein